MARTTYGGSPGDVVAVVSADDGDYAPGSGTFNVYNAASGGTQVTDLLTVSGAVITQVTPDADGMVEFQGPDGYAAALWLEQSTGGRRYRIDPADLAARVTSGGAVVTDHGALTGLGDDDHTQYHNNTRGDARYYTKTQVADRLKRFDVFADYAGNAQAAIDAAEAAGGGEVFFSQSYSSSTTLTVEAPRVHVTSTPNAVFNYSGTGYAVRCGVKTSTSAVTNILWDLRIVGTSAGLGGIHWIGVQDSRIPDPRISGFTGASAHAIVFDTASVSPYQATVHNEVGKGDISGNTNGIKLTKDAADPGTDGSNHNDFYSTRVQAFTGIGINVDHGENNNFFGCDASTNVEGTTGWRINDDVCTLVAPRADNSALGVGLANATGILITANGRDHVIVNPTGNGPLSAQRIVYEDKPNTPGLVIRNSFNRWGGAVDFDRVPTVNGSPLSTSGTGGTTATVATIEGAGTTGRAVMAAETGANARTAIGLSDVEFAAKVAEQRAAAPAFVIHYADDPDPTGLADNTVVLDVDLLSAEKEVVHLGSGNTTTSGTSLTFTPEVASDDDTTALLDVMGHQQSGTVATRGVGHVESVTGGGRTWTAVANTRSISTNNQLSLGRWVGIRSTGSTTDPIVVTMAAGSTGSAPTATHDRIGALLTGVTNTLGEVTGVTSGFSASTSPSVTQTGIESDAMVVGSWAINSNAADILPASGSPFSELPPSLVIPSNAAQLERAVAASVTDSMTLALSTTSATLKAVILSKVR